MKKSLIKKIVCQCGMPEDFVVEYVIGSASSEEGIRRMREYVKCVNKVIRKDKALKKK